MGRDELPGWSAAGAAVVAIPCRERDALVDRATLTILLIRVRRRPVRQSRYWGRVSVPLEAGQEGMRVSGTSEQTFLPPEALQRETTGGSSTVLM